jgi:hypothetical protein
LAAAAAAGIVCLGCLHGIELSARQRQAADPRLDVNDVSYLWPVPASRADVENLLSAADTLGDGVSTLWPKDAFDALLDAAKAVSVEPFVGPVARVNFGAFDGDISTRHTWKVVAFRVDPSAPGCDASSIAQFGSTPQLRLVLQPVTVNDGTVRVHDVTAHLAFSYVTGAGPAGRARPDTSAFREIVSDLVALKADATAAGAATTGPLRVHPALEAAVPGFAARVKAFVKSRVSEPRLSAMAFMGVDGSEPWIFFAMSRRADGKFALAPQKVLGGNAAQMLTLRGGAAVTPSPTTQNVGNRGVSTSLLFPAGAAGRLATAVFADEAAPLFRDIPDVIANPQRAHLFNTDCVSCHTESTRRTALAIDLDESAFRYAPPAGISGVDAGHLPRDKWNVRNLGWFHPRNGAPVATVTTRTANEAAESAQFVNREYLDGRAPSGSSTAINASRSETAMSELVASPLTLVMTIKSAQDFAELKALIGKLQSLPPDRNPITVALNRLGTVHFARFVFLGDRQLAVITTYDGSFEDYIDSFVNAIGEVFDQLLAHMSDAPPLPVSAHRAEFLAYVKKNDLTAVPPFYSAYPTLKVLDILTLQKQAGM